MRKTLGRLILILILSPIFSNKNMEVVSSNSSHYSDGYSQDITIILNDSFKRKTDDLADEIIGKYIDNNLDGIKFSFDKSDYADEVSVVIYKNKIDFENNKIHCKFKFEKTSDNPITYKY